MVALQTSLITTRKECQEKIQHATDEKEVALEKCGREWKRAIRKAAKRMNRDKVKDQHETRGCHTHKVSSVITSPTISAS